MTLTAKERLHYCEEHKDRTVQFIREMVEIESPSDNKQAVDRVSALIASRMEGLGGGSNFTAPRILATTCKSILILQVAASLCFCLVTMTLFIRSAH